MQLVPQQRIGFNSSIEIAVPRSEKLMTRFCELQCRFSKLKSGVPSHVTVPLCRNYNRSRTCRNLHNAEVYAITSARPRESDAVRVLGVF